MSLCIDISNQTQGEIVGRTVPSFRMALEGEISSWKDFRRSLGSGSREELDRMFNQARSNCMAAGNAVRPVVFEGMFMAIVFSHEERLAKLAKGIEELRFEMKPKQEPEVGEANPERA
jgi:hypothetical protein